jgi:hypothetical protein
LAHGATLARLPAFMMTRAAVILRALRAQNPDPLSQQETGLLGARNEQPFGDALHGRDP